ncbi:hypothetical protein, partial [Nocardia cyriacigeorgica]|uniref:hypothetical protein n=1 Tax=Nocardia cyriacigeorgica TaxID=135487 RepID=UPI00245590C0
FAKAYSTVGGMPVAINLLSAPQIAIGYLCALVLMNSVWQIALAGVIVSGRGRRADRPNTPPHNGPRPPSPRPARPGAAAPPRCHPGGRVGCRHPATHHFGGPVRPERCAEMSG